MGRLGIVNIVFGALFVVLGLVSLGVETLRLIGLSPFLMFLIYLISGILMIIVGIGFIEEHCRLENVENKCIKLSNQVDKLVNALVNEGKDENPSEEKQVLVKAPIVKKQNVEGRLTCKCCGAIIQEDGYCSGCGTQN